MIDALIYLAAAVICVPIAKPPATALDANPANAAATANETRVFGLFMMNDSPLLLKDGRSIRSARTPEIYLTLH